MTLSQSNEHLRVAFRGAYLAKLSGNFDPTREHLNFEVKRGGVICSLDKGYSIPRRMRDILKKRGIKDPNKGMLNPYYRTVANVILQGSRDQMHRLAFGDQKVNIEKGSDNSRIVRCPEIEKWAVDMYNFMSKKYGEDNIAAFVVHLDETNPHIHCTLLPINEKNKFSWKDYWGRTKEEGRNIYLQLHDELAAVNEKYGLERGDDKTRTGAKHRSTAQWRAEMSEKHRKENFILGNENKKLEGENEELRKSIIHAKARLKSLNTMIEHQEKRLADLNENVRTLEDKLARGQISNDEFDRQLAMLKKEIEKCQLNLFDKQGKLKIAQAQLDEILSKVSKENEKLSDVNSKIDKAKKELDVTLTEHDKAKFKEVQSFAYSATIFGMKDSFARFQENLSKLSPEQKKFVENVTSPLFEEGGVGLNVQELAEDGADVAAIATNLFLGYVNNATKISQGSGGGGGPTSGWGKRDDEDELAYMRRCFGMARKMKSSGRSQGRKR